jgi:hypothetical protein
MGVLVVADPASLGRMMIAPPVSVVAVVPPAPAVPGAVEWNVVVAVAPPVTRPPSVLPTPPPVRLFWSSPLLSVQAKDRVTTLTAKTRLVRRMISPPTMQL